MAEPKRAVINSLCMLDFLLSTARGTSALSPSPDTENAARHLYNYARACSIRAEIAEVIAFIRRPPHAERDLAIKRNSADTDTKRSALNYPKYNDDQIFSFTNKPNWQDSELISLKAESLKRLYFLIISSINEREDRAYQIFLELKFLDELRTIKVAQGDTANDAEQHSAVLWSNKRSFPSGRGKSHLDPVKYLKIICFLSIVVALTVFALSRDLIRSAIFCVVSIFPIWESIDQFVRRYYLATAGFPEAVEEASRSYSADEYLTAIVVPIMVASANDLLAFAYQKSTLSIKLGATVKCIVLLADLPDSQDQAKTCLFRDEREKIAEILHNINERLAGSGGCPIEIWHRDSEFSMHNRCWMGFGRKAGKIEEFIKAVTIGSEKITSIGQTILKKDDLDFLLILDDDSDVSKDHATNIIQTGVKNIRQCHKNENGQSELGYIAVETKSVLRDAVQTPSSILSSSLKADRYTPGGSISIIDSTYEMFGERQFSGKGLLNVRVAKRELLGKVDNERVLSHDVIETGLLGARLCPSAVICDSRPSSLVGDILRRERWYRGDIQNAISLWSTRQQYFSALRPFGIFLVNAHLITALAKPAVLLLLLASIFSTGSLRLGLIIGYVAFVAPRLVSVTLQIVESLKSRTFFFRVWTLPRSLVKINRDYILSLAIIPSLAALVVHAAVKSIGRLSFQRYLIQWTPSRFEGELGSWPSEVYFALAAQCIFAAFVITNGFDALNIAVGVIWFVSAFLDIRRIYFEKGR